MINHPTRLLRWTHAGEKQNEVADAGEIKYQKIDERVSPPFVLLPYVLVPYQVGRVVNGKDGPECLSVDLTLHPRQTKGSLLSLRSGPPSSFLNFF